MTSFELLGVATQVLLLMVAASKATIAVGLLRTWRRPCARVAPGDAWPTVDVVLPAHNEARRLPRVLASLLAQDYPGAFTLWVVDDRSDDDSRALLLSAADRDPRVRVVVVERPSRRWAPKVNAVWHGIRAGGADWIVTTDADCRHERGWLRSLMSHATGDTVLVCGHVDTAGPGEARGLLARFEALDWISLMLTARVLVRSGVTVASASSNHAYARAAFEAAGGFGVAARAPSGDEDLLVQRLGRLPGARAAFADETAARVRTDRMPDWPSFLDQRRRWFSRYHHALQYSPGFLAGVGVLGAGSLFLTLSLLVLPFRPADLAGVAVAWAVLLAVQVIGLHVGLHQLGRRDLMGPAVLAWAVLQPLTIAVAATWSVLRPGSWRAGARSYRRRMWRARLRRRRLARRPRTSV